MIYYSLSSLVDDLLVTFFLQVLVEAILYKRISRIPDIAKIMKRGHHCTEKACLIFRQ